MLKLTFARATKNYFFLNTEIENITLMSLNVLIYKFLIVIIIDDDESMRAPHVPAIFLREIQCNSSFR